MVDAGATAGGEASSSKYTATANLTGWFAGDWATDDKIDLLAQTYTVYSSLQKIAAERESSNAKQQKQTLIPSAQTLQYYHRISGLYREAIRRYMDAIALEQDEDAEEEENEDKEKEWEFSQAIHTTLHLAETLYFPADGRGAGVVGEEVLHWLNSFDFAPRTEDGQAIAQSAVPYEHASYWDYILRCVLRGFHSTAASLLGSLASSHPSHALQSVASRVAKLLASLPRSTNFTLEHDFLATHRRWLGQVRALLAGLEADMDDMEREMTQDEDKSTSTEDVEDERLELEAQFRCLVELMAGVRDRVFEACENWTEALGAWGVLVQPALKRDDVPQTMAAILQHFKLDPTRRPADAIQACLARGEVAQACKEAAQVDPWLAAHMADLVDKAGILAEEEKGNRSSERRHLIATYAETLLDDQGLWRMAIDYLASATANITTALDLDLLNDGETQFRNAVRRRMATILVSLDLIGPNAVSARSRARPKDVEEVAAEQWEAERRDEEGLMEEDGEVTIAAATSKRAEEDDVARIEEVLVACREHGMEREAKRVCRRVARQLLARQRFGEAVAFCKRADDVRGIRRIVQRILDVYLDEGADAFCKLVDSMPASLLGPSPLSMDEDMEDEIDLAAGFSLSTRLVFLAQYRDFHRLYAGQDWTQARSLLVEMLSSDSCPPPFYAVLLVDALPLLMPGQHKTHNEETEETKGQDGFTNEETMELLRILDEVMAASTRHPRLATHYLGPLQRLLVGPTANRKKETSGVKREDLEEEEVIITDVQASTRRLDILRLALAKRVADIVL